MIQWECTFAKFVIHLIMSDHTETMKHACVRGTAKRRDAKYLNIKRNRAINLRHSIKNTPSITKRNETQDGAETKARECVSNAELVLERIHVDRASFVQTNADLYHTNYKANQTANPKEKTK